MDLPRKERRQNPDRRSWKPTPSFPIVDCYSVLVTKDRRTTPDRRLNNIQVHWRTR